MDCLSVLEKLGHECVLEEKLSREINDESHNSFDIADADMIVSLGGDGALLRASKIAIDNDKKLLGINSGRLGYLCAMKLEEIAEFNEIIDRIVCKNRTLLSVYYDGKCYDALNDIIIAKKEFGKTVDLNVNVKDTIEYQLRADGLIVSTPTGSSAYNLSAGGPLIDLDTHAFALTPICTHNRDIYPHIINDDKVIDIQVNHDEAKIVVDGEDIGSFKDTISIKKAEKQLKLYRRK